MYLKIRRNDNERVSVLTILRIFSSFNEQIPLIEMGFMADKSLLGEDLNFRIKDDESLEIIKIHLNNMNANFIEIRE